jgi:hypothetical protein
MELNMYMILESVDKHHHVRTHGRCQSPRLLTYNAN